MKEILVPEPLVKTEERINFSQLFSEYLSELDIAPSSRTTYQTALTNLLNFFSETGISYPNRADLLRFKEVLCQNHSSKTVNLQLSVIRSFFSWTQFNRIYPNIAAGIKGVRTDKSPRRFDLTSSQIKEILDNIDQSSLCGRQKYAMVLLSTTTGLRAAEISNLDIFDLQVAGDTSILKVKGKGYRDKGQIVQIGKQTDKAIRSALSLREDFSLEDPLFISTSNFSYGTRISAKGISKILKNILKENHFTGPMYTGHSLRHSACTLGLAVTDRDLIQIKKFMRHKNLETTMIYADHEEFLSENIAEKIEEKLL